MPTSFAVWRCGAHLGTIEKTSLLGSSLHAPHAGEALWLEAAQSQLLLFVRVGDGRWAQPVAVSAAP